jgi:hypothetical protein
MRGGIEDDGCQEEGCEEEEEVSRSSANGKEGAIRPLFPF